LFRHGDRTPDKSLQYPNDPYKNMDFYPDGDGQLIIVRSVFYGTIDTLHHFVNLVIINSLL